MKQKRVRIYKSKWHLAVTLIIVGLPFVFLLLFSQFFHIETAVIFNDIGISFLRLVVAYIIAVVLAWVFGAAFYKGKRSLVVLPLFDVLQSFPTFAALPLATYFWGASDFTVIFFLVITVIWPILFSIVSSLKLTRHDWEEAVKISGIRGFDYLKYFLFPASVPGLITGSIIGLGEGWEALVATEIVTHIKTGLGNFFKLFENNLSVTMFGILGLLVFIFVINKLVWFPLLEWSHRKIEE